MVTKNSSIRFSPKDIHNIHISLVPELDAQRLPGLVHMHKGYKTDGKMQHLWPFAVVFEYIGLHTQDTVISSH